MTKSELTEWLERLPAEPNLLIWDADEQDWLPVTGGTQILTIRLTSEQWQELREALNRPQGDG